MPVDPQSDAQSAVSAENSPFRFTDPRSADLTGAASLVNMSYGVSNSCMKGIMPFFGHVSGQISRPVCKILTSLSVLCLNVFIVLAFQVLLILASERFTDFVREASICGLWAESHRTF